MTFEPDVWSYSSLQRKHPSQMEHYITVAATYKDHSHNKHDLSKWTSNCWQAYQCEGLQPFSVVEQPAFTELVTTLQPQGISTHRCACHLHNLVATTNAHDLRIIKSWFFSQTNLQKAFKSSWASWLPCLCHRHYGASEILQIYI